TIANDTTNAVGGRPDGFESLSHQVKSIVGGPTAKAFNTIFARIYDKVAEQDVPPGCLWCGDDEARTVTEQLVRDAGFEPIRVGGLQHAVDLEEFLLNLQFPIAQESGAYFYRLQFA